MKVKVLRNLLATEKSFEDFKTEEFSLNLHEFTPDLSLSCNECAKEEDDTEGADSPLSFLIKFKADKLKDPVRVSRTGVGGVLLPEGKQYEYQKERGQIGFFKSVTENQYNLCLTEDQLESVTLELYNDEAKRLAFNGETIEHYILSKYQTKEWKTLLASSQKKEWKKYVNQSLKRVFQRTYGDFKVDELKSAAKLDPDGLKTELKKLHDYGALSADEQTAIKKALGDVL
jgi:hypothetical protein